MAGQITYNSDLSYRGHLFRQFSDKLPTAKIIERSGGKYTLEAEVYGDGIKMWILSQGSRIKVTEPLEFVRELKEEILTMSNFYDDIK